MKVDNVIFLPSFNGSPSTATEAMAQAIEKAFIIQRSPIFFPYNIDKRFVKIISSKQHLLNELTSQANSVTAILCETADDIKTVQESLESTEVSFSTFCPLSHDDEVLLDFIEKIETEKQGVLITLRQVFKGLRSDAVVYAPSTPKQFVSPSRRKEIMAHSIHDTYILSRRPEFFPYAEEKEVLEKTCLQQIAAPQYQTKKSYVSSKEELCSLINERLDLVTCCLCEDADDVEMFMTQLKDLGISFETYSPFAPFHHSDGTIMDFVDKVEKTKKGVLVTPCFSFRGMHTDNMFLLPSSSTPNPTAQSILQRATHDTFIIQRSDFFFTSPKKEVNESVEEESWSSPESTKLGEEAEELVQLKGPTSTSDVPLDALSGDKNSLMVPLIIITFFDEGLDQQEEQGRLTYRDEEDVLKVRADKMERLEAELAKYRDKIKDIEFLKSKVEELKEENRILVDAQKTLEEELVESRRRCEAALPLENDLMRMQGELERSHRQGEVDRARIKDLQEENTALSLLQRSGAGSEVSHMDWPTWIRNSNAISIEPIEYKTLSEKDLRWVTQGSIVRHFPKIDESVQANVFDQFESSHNQSPEAGSFPIKPALSEKTSSSQNVGELASTFTSELSSSQRSTVPIQNKEKLKGEGQEEFATERSSSSFKLPKTNILHFSDKDSDSSSVHPVAATLNPWPGGSSRGQETIDMDEEVLSQVTLEYTDLVYEAKFRKMDKKKNNDGDTGDTGWHESIEMPEQIAVVRKKDSIYTCSCFCYWVKHLILLLLLLFSFIYLFYILLKFPPN